jgi:hypothetical protein
MDVDRFLAKGLFKGLTKQNLMVCFHSYIFLKIILYSALITAVCEELINLGIKYYNNCDSGFFTRPIFFINITT